MSCWACAGSALTTFNKGGMDLDPKVIAHRSPKTQGDMLVNPAAYDEFCAKGQLDDQVPQGCCCCCWLLDGCPALAAGLPVLCDGPLMCLATLGSDQALCWHAVPHTAHSIAR